MLTYLQYINRHFKEKFVVLFHFELSSKKRICIKREFQRYVNSQAFTKQLKFSIYDHDTLISTFRLMSIDVILTQANKCILMKSQHMSSAEKQKKCRVLRVIQKKNVKIVKFLCFVIKIETMIVNTSKLRQYFAIAMMKTENDNEKTENNENNNMINVWNITFIAFNFNKNTWFVWINMNSNKWMIAWIRINK